MRQLIKFDKIAMTEEKVEKIFTTCNIEFEYAAKTEVHFSSVLGLIFTSGNFY